MNKDEIIQTCMDALRAKGLDVETASRVWVGIDRALKRKPRKRGKPRTGGMGKDNK